MPSENLLILNRSLMQLTSIMTNTLEVMYMITLVIFLVNTSHLVSCTRALLINEHKALQYIVPLLLISKSMVKRTETIFNFLHSEQNVKMFFKLL